MELKEVLGDRYQDVEILIGNRNFIVDDGKLIPKYRFDEINARLKKAEQSVQALTNELTGKKEEIRRLCGQIEEIKDGYQKAMSILKIKEIFVNGGLTENEYRDIVQMLIQTDQQTAIEIATHFIKILKNKEKS